MGALSILLFENDWHGGSQPDPSPKAKTMHLAKRPALRRYWIIDRELRKKNYPTVEQLAKLAEVNQQTIRRDIEALQRDHQAPIDFNRARQGWEYTEDTYTLPAVIITEGELVAMFLAGQALQQAYGSPYAADLQRAIKKLSDFLPDEVSIHWQALDHAQSFHQTVTSLQDLDIFRKIADAALRHRQIKIRYWTASRDAESERLIDPYHLACIDGTWYVIAWCHKRQETRTFAASRVRDVAETGEVFTAPQDFRMGDYFDGTFKVISDGSQSLQSIRLKFAPSAAKYIREKIWHASQQLHVNSDQSVVLELSLRSLIEVRRWVLSWGRECEVLAPAELREDIRREAAAMIAQSSAVADFSALEKIREKIRRQPPRRKQTG